MLPVASPAIHHAWALPSATKVSSKLCRGCWAPACQSNSLQSRRQSKLYHVSFTRTPRMYSIQMYQHTKRHQPRRTAPRLLRLSVSREPLLLRLISLQPLRRTLIQLALERLLLFLLRIRNIASSGAQLLHGSSAIARELSAENTAWGRGERHGRECVGSRESKK